MKELIILAVIAAFTFTALFFAFRDWSRSVARRKRIDAEINANHARAEKYELN